MPIEVRSERPDDIDTIRILAEAAFKHKSYSKGTEGRIVDALRDADALTISLVACTHEGEIVGHAAVSAVTIDGSHMGWFGMGPVSVRPDRQTQGVGKALIQECLARLRQAGGRGCVLLGDPGYYRRFGFDHNTGMRFEGAPAAVFMMLSLDGNIPSGKVLFHQAFSVS